MQSDGGIKRSHLHGVGEVEGGFDSLRLPRRDTPGGVALAHHCHKLMVVDAPVVILVDVAHKLLHLHVAHVELLARALQLLRGEVPAVVLVEVAERGHQVLLTLHLLSMASAVCVRLQVYEIDVFCKNDRGFLGWLIA